MVDNKGLIHIYTGNGKGKTTAALGMAMRAAGWGWKVLIIQFLKGGVNYGERKFLEDIKILLVRRIPIKSGEGERYKDMKKKKGEIEIKSFGREGMVDPKKPLKIDLEEASKALARWRSEMETKKWNLIILDEINVAIKFGLIPLSTVLDLIKKKPKNLELVLTGRWLNPEIIKLADYASEIKEIKHPYKKGISARAGIEY